MRRQGKGCPSGVRVRITVVRVRRASNSPTQVPISWSATSSTLSMSSVRLVAAAFQRETKLSATTALAERQAVARSWGSSRRSNSSMLSSRLDTLAPSTSAFRALATSAWKPPRASGHACWTRVSSSAENCWKLPCTAPREASLPCSPRCPGLKSSRLTRTGRGSCASTVRFCSRC